MLVSVKRGGKIYESEYRNGGQIVKQSHLVGNTNRTGTTVKFKPDPKIFSVTNFNP
jgi:topoisomerase-4 subunit B